MPPLSGRHRLLLILFAIACYFAAGNVAHAIHVLLHEDEAPDAYFPVRTATREFGSSPYYLWQIVSIDGQPFRHADQVQKAIRIRRPGDRIPVTMKDRKGEIKEVTIPVVRDISLKQRNTDLLFMGITVFLQVFCLGLAFLVAGLRPYDPLAWLLLALLLSFGESVRPFSWDWPFPAAALLWHIALPKLWPICMMLFGLYFPQRSIIDIRLPWLKWLLIAVISGLSVFTGAVYFVWTAVDIGAASPFRDALMTSVRIENIAGMIATSLFFAGLGVSSGRTRDRDARRRLTFIWTGASVSLSPLFLIALYGLFTNRDMFIGVPAWIITITFSTLPIFPLTLAYVIVVQRAMNLSVALRLGLQYALARRGLRIIQVATVVVILMLVQHGIRKQMRAPDQLAIIGAGVTVIMLQRRVALRLSDWIDRRFFREAYSADQVLIDISEQARNFTETRPLLETVTERVARTLHIPRAAVLLRDGDNYCLAKSVTGFDPSVRCLPLRARAIEHIRKDRKPALVYFDDKASWVNLIEPEEKLRLLALDAQVLVALSGRDDLVGVMVLGPKQSEEPYTRNDLQLLQSIGAQTGLAIENSELLAKLTAEAAKRERINREIEIAREVQERLFPQSYPPVPGIDYFGYCRPALGIGGDYYDFIPLSGGRLGIAIGDVSGKGVAAALVMSNLHASLRGQTLAQVTDLSALMSNVNTLLYEASTSSRYATFFYGEYDPVSRVLQFVNAGHNAPMVVRGGECLRLEAGGPVVGLLKQATYDQMSIQLEPGDILVGYTDGISEAMTLEDEEWGEERLLASIQASGHQPAKQIIDYILQGADAFTTGAPQYDDMTLSITKIAAA